MVVRAFLLFLQLLAEDQNGPLVKGYKNELTNLGIRASSPIPFYKRLKIVQAGKESCQYQSRSQAESSYDGAMY